MNSPAQTKAKTADDNDDAGRISPRAGACYASQSRVSDKRSTICDDFIAFTGELTNYEIPFANAFIQTEFPHDFFEKRRVLLVMAQSRASRHDGGITTPLAKRVRVVKTLSGCGPERYPVSLPPSCGGGKIWAISLSHL
ncbi:hypothetical protein [Zavarzinella formosa]|uniref:hypothetical protein n=1 Tax=Zavarzinella formosa TaxID=360055 RepID=UPI0012F78905|nr:hypothetical protein [Zavarzinella formosa]